MAERCIQREYYLRKHLVLFYSYQGICLGNTFEVQLWRYLKMEMFGQSIKFLFPPDLNLMVRADPDESHSVSKAERYGKIS